MEKFKMFANNSKSVLTFLIVLVVFYNMVVVPVLAFFGIPAPVLIVDEAVKFLMTLSTLGAM